MFVDLLGIVEDDTLVIALSDHGVNEDGTHYSCSN